jgi:hypothetical protein
MGALVKYVIEMEPNEVVDLGRIIDCARDCEVPFVRIVRLVSTMQAQIAAQDRAEAERQTAAKASLEPKPPINPAADPPTRSKNKRS